MALQVTGNKLVLVGVSEYIRNSEKVNKAIDKQNAALKKQTEVAAKTALPTANLEAQSKSIGRKMVDAITSPFRAIGKLLSGIFNVAVGLLKTAIFGPFKILGMLMANVLRGVVVTYITSKIYGWIFEGKAPIPAGWKNKIGSALGSTFQKLGGEAGQKFLGAFQKYGGKFFQAKLGGMLADVIGLQSKGPLGRATSGIVDSIFGGVGKLKDIGGAIHENKAWGDLFKNLTTGAQNALKPVTQLGGSLVKNVGSSALGSITSGLSGIVAALGPLAPAIAAVAAAFIGFKLAMAGFKAFLKLGERGSAFEGVIASFDILARQAQQVPDALLNNMRKAANGTISDLDLITNANLALAGATGDTAKIVGEGLPKLLEIARAQARSTGKDVNFLFNSLVEGVKKAQPELIDNTGLLVRVGEANEELAKSLGKSVDALSAQERQQAILNATLKAGESAVKQLAGAQLTAAEIQQQIDTNQKNALDTLALAVQPVYKVFLTIKRTISAVVLDIVRFVAPFIFKVGEIIAAFADGVSSIANRILKIFKPIVKDLQYAAAVFSLLFDALKIYIKFYFQVWAKGLDAVGKILGWLGEQLIKIFPFLKIFQDGLFIGAAKAFGSFAAGILVAANKYIFPAIIGIATFIADFLMGNSPPPLGPLSTIDQGGANIMQAWLGGITGVSLEPVSQVAVQVTVMLGRVATLLRDQVKSRLNELDTALQPFQDRLDLIKARLESLTKPLETARDMIAKKLDKATQLLTQGGDNAAEVQALDKQLELINQRLNLSQEELQNAQLQFDLAQAQQAEERAALAIRERMLGVTEDITDATAESANAAAATGGGGSEATAAAASGLPSLTGGLSAGDSILGLDAIKGALADLQGAAVGQFINEGGDKALAEAQGNIGKLKAQTGRIAAGSTKLVTTITGPFKDLADTFSGIFADAEIQFNNYFGEEGSITKTISGIGTTFSNIFGEGGTIPSFFVGDESVFAKISSNFNEHFGPESPLSAYFGEGGLFGAGGAIETAFGALFGGADTEGTLLYQLTGFKTGITDIFASIFTNDDSPLQTAMRAVSSVGSMIWGIFNSLVQPNSTLSISLALSSIKSVFQASLVNPTVDAVESMANSIIDTINKAIENVWNDMPGIVREASKRLGLDLGSFQISHIDVPYPEFHQGGVVRANLLKGEGVISIPMMNTLSKLESYLSAPSFTSPVMGPAGASSTSIDRSQNYSVGELHYHEQPRLRRPRHEMRRMALMGRF